MIGVIPQDFRFFEKTTPKEAIEYYATLFGVDVDAMGLLEQVALADKAHAHFDVLSGGQKQKLGLALSLVATPRSASSTNRRPASTRRRDAGSGTLSASSAVRGGRSS